LHGLIGASLDVASANDCDFTLHVELILWALEYLFLKGDTTIASD